MHYLQKELETLFQTDSSTLEFLQHGTLDGLWYWDLENPEEEWMSPEFWMALGIDPSTRAHKAAEWQDLIFPEDLELAVFNFREHCANPDHPFDQVVRYWHADGSTVWVRCRGIAIRDEQGNAVRMLGAHNNLTAVKHAEDEWRRQAQLAAASNAELRDFAYAMSHDMKAPTNTLQMIFAELSGELDDNEGSNAAELVRMGNVTIERMQSLIHDLLRYTHLVDAVEPHCAVDLGDIADRARQSLSAAIEEADATLVICDELPTIEAREQSMLVLFQNLIGNALKFRAPDRRASIRVDCEQDTAGQLLRLRIQDNGIGIPAEFHERVFGMFQRLHLQTTHSGSGLGLGLCRRIAVDHGGGIRVDSTVGRGSTFVVELPIASLSLRPSDEAAAASFKPRAETLTR